jgi:hypothetical protein
MRQVLVVLVDERLQSGNLSRDQVSSDYKMPVDSPIDQRSDPASADLQS